MDSQLFESLGDVVARSHHVADVEVGRDLQVDSAGAVGGRAIEVIRAQAGISDGLESFAEDIVAALRRGFEGVALGGKRCGMDGEC